MELWLSWNNNEEQIRLPILPESFFLSLAGNNTKLNLHEVGDINLKGNIGLKEITLESFFPNPDNEYYFAEHNDYMKPYECVEMIESWMLSDKPIRLIITTTPINLPMLIDNFKEGEEDFSGDVAFTMELSEYKFIKTQEVNKDRKEYKSNPKTKRSNPKKIPNSYIVKKGDSLYTIAKKLTGNGTNYKEIAKKNKLKNPNKLKIGQKLVI